MVKSKPARDMSHVRAFRALLASHARVTEQVKKSLLERTGLGLSEFDMLAELGNQPALRMGDLAKKLITSPANITRVAQSLEEKGLVQRMRPEHSDREVQARLTPQGQQFFEQHFLGMVEKLGEIWDGSLNKAEQAELALLLDK